MLHKENSDGKKNKPRGRPPIKNNFRGEFDNDLLALKRHEINNGGGSVDQNEESKLVEPENADKKDFIHTNKIGKDDQEESLPLKLMEKMDFTNGNNVLSIRFSKRHNRMFRIQIFLNDEFEVRPTTYNGNSTASSFWELLKKMLKK